MCGFEDAQTQSKAAASTVLSGRGMERLYTWASDAARFGDGRNRGAVDQQRPYRPRQTAGDGSGGGRRHEAAA